MVNERLRKEQDIHRPKATQSLSATTVKKPPRPSGNYFRQQSCELQKIESSHNIRKFSRNKERAK